MFWNLAAFIQSEQWLADIRYFLLKEMCLSVDQMVLAWASNLFITALITGQWSVLLPVDNQGLVACGRLLDQYWSNNSLWPWTVTNKSTLYLPLQNHCMLTFSPPFDLLLAKFLVCFNCESATMSLKVGENVIWVSNSLELYETPSNSTFHLDLSCLQRVE